MQEPWLFFMFQLPFIDLLNLEIASILFIHIFKDWLN